MKQNKLPRHTHDIIDTINRDLGIAKFRENEFGLSKKEIKRLNASLKGLNGEKPVKLFTSEEQKTLKRIENKNQKKFSFYEEQAAAFHFGRAVKEQNPSAYFLEIVYNIIPETPLSKINLRFLGHRNVYMIITNGTYREHLIKLAKENAEFNDRQSLPDWYGFGETEDRPIWDINCEKEGDILAPKNPSRETLDTLFWKSVFEENHPDRVRQQWDPVYQEYVRNNLRNQMGSA